MSSRNSESRQRQPYDPASDEVDEEDRHPPRRVAIVPTKALVPVCGVCCIMLSCYCKAPACLGCYSKYWICCCNQEAVCCKPTKEPGYNCVCFRMEVLTGTCPALLQMEQQCFCSDCRCACPQTPYGFPCIFTCCFYTCCYRWRSACKCCASIGFITYYTEGLDQVDQSRRYEDIINSHSGSSSGRAGRANAATGTPNSPGVQAAEVQLVDATPPMADVAVIESAPPSESDISFVEEV